jgi:hypothetical protein
VVWLLHQSGRRCLGRFWNFLGWLGIGNACGARAGGALIKGVAGGEGWGAFGSVTDGLGPIEAFSWDMLVNEVRDEIHFIARTPTRKRMRIGQASTLTCSLGRARRSST